MKRTRILILFCFIVCNSIAQNNKDTVWSFTLKQAQDYAIQNNATVKNANLDLESAKKKIWETTALGLPQVGSTLSFSYQITVPDMIKQLSGMSQYFSQDTTQQPITENQLRWGLTYDITASQLLFSGSYLVGLQTAKVYKELSEAGIVKSQDDVLEQVSNAYFLVLIAQENKSILDTTYANTSKMLEYIKSIYAQGFVEETDVDQMQLTVSTLQNARDMITRQLDVAKNLLKFEMGIELAQTMILTDDLNALLVPIELAGLTIKNFKVENNIDFKLMATQEKLSTLYVKLQKSTLLPDVAAFYTHQENFNKNSFSFTPPNLIGFSMNIPIFGSGMKIAKIKQAKIALLKIQNTKEQVSLGLQTEYSSAQSTYITDLNNYLTKKQNVILAQKIYNKNFIKYKEGIIGSLELTLAQNQYLQAQTDYYLSIIDFTTAKSKLEKLLK